MPYLRLFFVVFLYTFLAPTFKAQATPIVLESQELNPVEPPNYILYWGFLEGKFKLDKTGTRYEARTEIAPAEFRKTILRAPRLWTGKEVLKSFKFIFEGIVIDANEESQESYKNARGVLDNLAVRADNGTQYVLKLTLPDGKPGQFFVDFKIPEVGTGEKEFWQKSGLMAKSIWGEPLADLTANQEFVNHEDLMGALDLWIARMKEVPLTSDRSAFISVIVPDEQPYEIEVPRNIADSLEQVALRKKLSPKKITPSTQIFFQIRPTDAWVGDFLMFNVTKDDDPTRNLKKYDRRMFGFEWGGLRFELKGYYGKSIQMANGKTRPIDPEKTHEEKEVTVERLSDIITKPMYIWEKGAVIKKLQYELEIDDKIYSIESEKGIPLMTQNDLKSRLGAGKTVLLKNFTGEGLDLRNLSFKITPKD